MWMLYKEVNALTKEDDAVTKEFDAKDISQ